MFHCQPILNIVVLLILPCYTNFIKSYRTSVNKGMVLYSACIQSIGPLIPTPFSASLGSILAMQQLRNDYSLTFPPLSIARYSCIQLSRLRGREVKENAQTSKQYQRGFEPGLSRLRVRHSTTQPPRSTDLYLYKFKKVT